MADNYEKEISVINTKIEFLKEKIEKQEMLTNSKIDELKQQLSIVQNNLKADFLSIDDKLNSIVEKVNFSKGFLKALVVLFTVITASITIAIKFI